MALATFCRDDGAHTVRGNRRTLVRRPRRAHADVLLRDTHKPFSLQQANNALVSSLHRAPPNPPPGLSESGTASRPPCHGCPPRAQRAALF